MVKVIFELQGQATYYTQNGVAIHRDVPYWQYTAQGIDPETAGIVYHDREPFYRKTFEGKGVWALIEEIDAHRRRAEFPSEIRAAAQAANIDLDQKDFYYLTVEPVRIK